MPGTIGERSDADARRQWPGMTIERDHDPLRCSRPADRLRRPDRRAAARVHRRALSGRARRSLRTLRRQAQRPRGQHSRGDGERHPAGARAARAGGGAGRRGAGGGRHRVPGPVPQPAGVARYSRCVVGRGAGRRARHFLLARHLRDPGVRLRRRIARGRGGLSDRLGGALARSDSRAGADRRGDRLAARRRRRPDQISRRSLQPASGDDVLAARQPRRDRASPISSRCSARSRSAPSCWSRCAGA